MLVWRFDSMNIKMKKFGLFVVALICCFSFIGRSYAFTCDVLDGVEIDQSIVDLISTVITIIQIAVPVILVIFGMLDLVKGVMAQKEDEIKKGQQVLIKRAITAVLVFFVIAIVKLIMSLAAGSTNAGVVECANCLINGGQDCAN